LDKHEPRLAGQDERIQRVRKVIESRNLKTIRRYEIDAILVDVKFLYSFEKNFGNPDYEWTVFCDLTSRVLNRFNRQVNRQANKCSC
jgi:hypothetical protein